MYKNLFLLLAVAHIGYTMAAEESDSVGNKKLPTGAVLMCSEHIAGEASGKPVHIVWQAFGLDEEISKTVQFYQAQFRQPPAIADAQSYTWIFNGEHDELHYSVEIPSAAGPWSGCKIQPANFKAIILISNAIWTGP